MEAVSFGALAILAALHFMLDHSVIAGHQVNDRASAFILTMPGYVAKSYTILKRQLVFLGYKWGKLVSEIILLRPTLL